ncbi:GNAT family N-acetyltransferase, partial [Bacillus velezensis]
MAITLQPMTGQEFQSYLAHSAKHYAEEKVKAGTWLPDEAPELAELAFNDLLPDGLETADHYLWTLTLDGKENAGWLWLHADP